MGLVAHFVGLCAVVIISGYCQLHSYFILGGEIVRMVKDELPRKHLPRDFSLIKNEGDRQQ